MKTEEAHRRKQVAFYERTASKFDRSWTSLGCRDNRNHAAKIGAIAAAIGAAGGGRILEVGAGTGLHGRWLLENTPVGYTGIDLSEPMLRLGARRLESYGARARLTIGDACKLPFADGFFDAAFCSGTLHHLAEPRMGLRELVRVTKPGGRVAAMEPNWKWPSTLVFAAVVPEERNAFKINPTRLLEWARDEGIAEPRLERLLYTPPKPVAWSKAYDRIDRAFTKVPGLRALSINLLVWGTRR